jgi:hypothetical protein
MRIASLTSARTGFKRDPDHDHNHYQRYEQSSDVFVSFFEVRAHFSA